MHTQANTEQKFAEYCILFRINRLYGVFAMLHIICLHLFHDRKKIQWQNGEEWGKIKKSIAKQIAKM